MFIPFSILITLLIQQTKSIKLNNGQIIKIGFCSFFASVLIEIFQTITRLGTFKFSDIVYNTLGGVLGAVIFIIINLIIKKKRS